MWFIFGRMVHLDALYILLIFQFSISNSSKVIDLFQGSQCTWKTWKNDDSFSSHGKIMEFYNFAKYHGKMGKILEKGTVCDFCTCDFFLLYRALPIQMYFWEKFWYFQMAGYMGLLGLACSWITRREIEPQPTVALRLHLVRLVLTALANLFTLPWGRLRLGGNQGFTLGKGVKPCHLGLLLHINAVYQDVNSNSFVE